MAEDSKSGSVLDKLPLGGLKDKASEYGKSLVNHTLGKASDKVEDVTGQLTDYANGESSVKGKAAKEGAKAAAKGESPAKGAIGGALSGVKDKVADVFTGGGGSGSKSQKLVNIVEWIDVGVPINIAYNQWTQFEDWSDFMKKVESVEHNEEEGTVSFKGQVFWSHREWESTIKEMVPDDRIIWSSTGSKGHLDGGVTFHQVADRLTRICIVVEYYPQGFFEKTAQIWRAVGRRVQVEMKRYVRHVMTTTILDPDSVEGWRGEIRDEEIVRTHEEVVEDEQAEAEEGEEPEDGEAYDDEYEEEPDADTEEVGEDEDYKEDPDAEEDSEADDEGEYEAEPEAGEEVADEDEGIEREDESDAGNAEEPADEEEEPAESAEPDEEPVEEVAEDAEAPAEEPATESEEAEEEPERPRRKRK
ncbi:SRPBCC family protein [Arthrobacter pigmenti]